MDIKEIFKTIMSDPYLKIGLVVILIVIGSMVFRLALLTMTNRFDGATSKMEQPTQKEEDLGEDQPREEKKEEQPRIDNRKGFFNEEEVSGTQTYIEGDVVSERTLSETEIKEILIRTKDYIALKDLKDTITIAISPTSNGHRVVLQLEEALTKAGYKVIVGGVVFGSFDGIEFNYTEKERYMTMDVGNIKD